MLLVISSRHTPITPRHLFPPLYHRFPLCSNFTIRSDVQQLRLLAAASGSCSILPAVLVGLLGAGMVETAYADVVADVDADKVSSKPPLPSEPPTSHVNLEETAKKEKWRIEQRLKDKGIRYGSYSQFTVDVKGQKVTIKFQIPPGCEVAQLIVNLVSHLGLKVEERGGGGSDMLINSLLLAYLRW
ncbi:hypothetical protein HRI_002582800 [Hibiscus trionum]|uniref:Uncharacterized protein n=1 Tax=Hibiscus trionum TaxID=183268 RepID=A0A9W7M892_HIBTR|nr:hypothetical protein HRI_002582800 [Hibiscus trionum]